MPNRLHPSQIPSTGRKTTFQVKQLGFGSIPELAGSLPKKALVLDVGAGLSRLGHEVAALRPDIRWINLDPCYKDEGILATAKHGLPKNVRLLSEDIVTGGPELTRLQSKADLVYTYWLLPHLALETEEPAKVATGNMYDLLKPNGKIIVGPVKHWGFGFLSPFRYSGTKTYSKSETKEQVVTAIVASTKLWWLPRFIQLFSNRHGIHVGLRFVGGQAKKRG